jgi:hypothetical protein
MYAMPLAAMMAAQRRAVSLDATQNSCQFSVLSFQFSVISYEM